MGMASRRALEPEVLKPKELRGPEAVGLREYLRGSGMGPSPNISRTVMLKKYCMYSMWFHRWNQAQWVGLKERMILDSTKRSFLIEQLRNSRNCLWKERVSSISWMSELELHREGFCTVWFGLRAL